MKAKESKLLEDIVENVHNLGACKYFLNKTQKAASLIGKMNYYPSLKYRTFVYQKTPIRK